MDQSNPQVFANLEFRVGRLDRVAQSIQRFMAAMEAETDSLRLAILDCELTLNLALARAEKTLSRKPGQART